MRSSGSITLPLTLLILSPVSSTTRPWSRTREKGGAPELPGDAPIEDIGHPVLVGLGPLLGDDLRLALAHRAEGGLRQRLHLDEPLGRDHRLDDRRRPLALRQDQLMLL